MAREIAGLPRRNLGIAYPLPLADTVYWQFYRACGMANNLVVSHFEVDSFAPERVEAAVPSIHASVDRLARRGADLYRITGVPVLAALGRPRALDLARQASDRVGAPVGLDFEDTVRAVRALGGRRFVFTAKWEPALLDRAVDYLRHAGLDGHHVAGADFRPDTLWRIGTDEGVDLALRLGREALRRRADADVLVLAGGAWLSTVAVPVLEAEFGLPVVTNLDATFWAFLQDAGVPHATDGLGSLFRQVARRDERGQS
ncbi:aspartate racemase/maleate isomerase family protein [Rhizomonospora bruguierae]|uniref:aspartate racemase/maleate isomerase family protein n=1 Tax=Rhizomonospora bruguierae TaxID=1581705 RepID=UPI001BCF7551|nr:hypothetical protein [Micromonospora sp. NBRC 107566]